jgi:hypothetical protein
METNTRDTFKVVGKLGLFSAFLLFALAFPVSMRLVAAESYAVTVERNVAAKMRDGVTLRADVYRPKAEGKFPVLLVRTPYDKTGSMGFGLKAAAQGYVVIAQDVRGRFESEGEWYTFKYESQEAEASLTAVASVRKTVGALTASLAQGFEAIGKCA